MTAKTYEWEHLVSFAGGRKYFRDKLTQRIGTVGDSGRTPDRGEEGVLWVDTDRPIVLDVDYSMFRAHLPLIAEASGKSCGTLAETIEALWVVKNLGMSIKINAIARDRRNLPTGVSDEITFNHQCAQ
jgi:hypothetical protein